MALFCQFVYISLFGATEYFQSCFEGYLIAYGRMDFGGNSNTILELVVGPNTNPQIRG